MDDTAPLRRPRRVAVYLRLSLDPEGTKEAIERQRVECTRLVEGKGWIVADTFVDRDLSAYKRVVRPAYAEMMAGLRDGLFDAVCVFKLDRLTRRFTDTGTIVEALTAANAVLLSVHDSIDTSTPMGQAIMGVLVAQAETESRNTSIRVASANKHRAATGAYFGSGSRQLGYNRDGTHHPTEAPFVRAAVNRLLNGDSLAAVLEDGKASGMTPAGNGRWRTANLRRSLQSPRLAGLQVYRGAVIGEGTWEPIVERADWDKLQLIFGRRTTGRRVRRHLLTGIARCGRDDCGSKLTGVWANDHGRVLYRCDKSGVSDGCGRLSIFGDLLEHLVVERLIYVLSGPDADAVLAQTMTDESATLLEALRDDESALERLTHDHYVERSIPKPAFTGAKNALEDRIMVTRNALAKCSGPAVDLPRAEELLRVEWERHGIAWRRAVVDSVIERVIVKPNTPGLRHDPGRVEVRWRF